MNKYNIQVGDEIDDSVVRYVNSTGIVFNNINAPRYEHSWESVINYIESKRWAITKRVEMKKIVGYKLLKDTPEYKAGQVFTKNEERAQGQSHIYVPEGSFDSNDYYYGKSKVEGNTEWFEPIYESKPTEVFVDTLAGKVRVSKTDLSLVGETPIVHSDAKYIFDLIKNSTGRAHYTITIETFKVGCKTFHVDDIPKLQEAIKQVTDES